MWGRGGEDPSAGQGAARVTEERVADPRPGNRRPLLLCTLAAAFVLAGASPAASHAVLERSIPAANAAVASPPSEVVLSFTEPVDPAFSTVRITDNAGGSIPATVTASADGRGLTAAVGPLPRGVYVVRWRVLSSYDGHTSSGFFLFGVGQSVPSELAGEGTEGTPPLALAVRWLTFAAAVVIVGAAIFQTVVLRPALPRLQPGEATHGAAVISAVIPAAAAALIVGTTLDFLDQAAQLLGVSWRQMLAGGTVWSLLGGTRLGWSVLVRTSMALIFLIPASPPGRILRAVALLWMLMISGIVALFGGPASVTGAMLPPVLLTTAVYGAIGALITLVATKVFQARVDAPWVLPLAGVGLLAGFTISSHAAADGLLAIIADWLHLAAAAGWTGGLLALLLVLRAAAPPERTHVAAVLVPPTSTLAGWGLLIVVVTGVYSSILRIPAVQAFEATPYGRLLAAKLLVVAVLVGLGAVNRYFMRPRLESSGAEPRPLLTRRFIRLVGGEVAAVACILAIVALLTITPPASTTWKPAGARTVLRLAGLTGDVRVTLAVSPAEPGQNRFEVAATSTAGALTGADVRVLLRLTKLDEPLDPVLLSLAGQGDGRFLADDAALGLPGWWEVEVIVRRRGRLDVSTSFPLRLAGPSAGSAPSGAVLLGQMTSTMFQLRTWREAQQITDGAGNVAMTWFEFVHPDRLRYRTATGTEAVIIGHAQYIRSGAGPWEARTLADAFWVDGYLGSYFEGAQDSILGRQISCDREDCVVVFWEAPAQSAAFAAWVGLQSHRMHRLMMVAPSHYMTARLSDFNAALSIAPPR
jgi:copper transport protein